VRYIPKKFAKIAVPALCALLIGCAAPDDTKQAISGGGAFQTTDLNQFFECLEENNVTLISAHRGGDPENSLTGMKKTLERIPAIMEIDIATSKDGVLFLLHDDTLNRTTTGSGVAADKNWAEIEGLKVKDTSGRTYDEHPPRFDDVLDWANGKTFLQIDFKRSTRYEDVVAAVKKADATDRIAYIAYTFAQARKLHRLHPDAMISMTLDDLEDYDRALADGIPAENILGWTGNVQPDQAVFDQLNANDIEVIFGTLGGNSSIDNQIARSGNEARYSMIASQGVDILATDRPFAAADAIKKAGREIYAPACSR
jgi:glycerophosphoryl diester phosphodiesterase